MDAKRLRVLGALGVCLLGWNWAVAQQVAVTPRARPAPPQEAQPSLRADSSLVLVPVTVCDPLNRPVTGLDRDNFRVFDDRVEQQVTHFAMDDAPLAVGLVFDMSGSMSRKLSQARAAAAQFIRTANPEDEFLLVEFNERPRLAVPLTRDGAAIQSQLARARARGATALLDAIQLAIGALKKSAVPRKALLILSDGGDNASRYTVNEIRKLVLESDVLIYAIGIFEPVGVGARSAEELAGPWLLSELSEQTGGREFPVSNLAELPDIASKISVELRNRYVLGFAPAGSPRDGKYHRLQVKVEPPRGLPPLRAYWRQGYFAPED
jgi:VWFA-related protein